jgi:hypothetical protein
LWLQAAESCCSFPQSLSDPAPVSTPSPIAPEAEDGAPAPKAQSGIGRFWPSPKWRKRLGLALVVVVLLPLLAYGLFLIPAVQTGTAKSLANWASARSGTTVDIERIRLRMIRKFYFGGVHIDDFNGDTLLHAEQLVLRVDRFQPFTRRLDLRHVRARNAHFVMRREREDEDFSFDTFIARLGGAKDKGEDGAPEGDSPASGGRLEDAGRGTDPAYSADPNQEGGEGKAPVGERASPEGGKKRSGKPWKLTLDAIELADSRFQFLDGRNRSFLTIDMPYFGIALRRADPVNKFLHARSLDAQDLDIRMYMPDTLKGPRLKARPEVPSIDPGGWVFRVDEFRFRNSRYAHNNAWRAPREGLDFGHLDIRGIELAMRDLSYAVDTIQGRIDRIEGLDHSGARIVGMEADVRFSTQELLLTGLRLETSGSVLQDSFHMQYASFHDFKHFEDRVRLDARLENSRLAMADLRWFAPGLESVSGSVAVDGHYYGEINDLRGRGVDLDFGSASRLRGRFNVNGLTDPENAFVEFRLEGLQSNARDLNDLLPGVDFPPRLPELGLFQASGEFIGFPRDFVAFGDLQTAIGEVRSDVNLKIDEALDEVRYSGNIEMEAFDLGRWTGNTAEWLGPTTVQSSVQGSGAAKGFAVGKLSAELGAKASQVTVRGYAYDNMEFDGTLTEGFVEGALVSRDANFDLDFEGTIDLREALPVFDFRSDLRFVDFQALGFTRETLRLIGGVELNMVGDHIDSLRGMARVRNLFIQDSLRIYTLDSIRLTANENADGRSMELSAPGIRAAVEGHYQLSRMPDAIRQLLAEYFPDAGIQPENPVPDQDLTFAVSIRNSRGFQRLLLPELGDLHQVSMSGSLASAQNAFDFRARIPDPKLGRLRLENWLIDVHTAEGSINGFSRVDRLAFTDSLVMPVTELRTDYAGDSLIFRILMGSDLDRDRMNLAGVVRSADSSFQFRILPSEIVTGGARWNVDPNNSLAFGKNKLLAENFTVRNGEQRIALHSLDKAGYSSWLDLDLERVQIGDLLNAFKLNPARLSGELNGRISASNITEQLGFAGNVRVDGMALDGLPFGSTVVNASLQRPQNRLNYTIALTGENRLTGRGYLELKPEGAVQADLDIERLSVAPFGRYLEGLLDQIEGDLSGDAKLRGSFKDPRFSGALHLDDGGLRLVYLNSHYSIPEVDMQWTDGKLAIAPCQLFDPYGNSGSLEGSLRYGPLDNWRFDNLNIRTEQLLFMDTEREENPDFFGTAFGAGRVRIDGPTNDLTVTVNARSNPGTSLTVPITYGPSVGGSDFIQFFDPNAEVDPEVDEKAVRRRLSRVRFDLFLDINREAEVVLELLGDQLRGRGNGTLQLNLSTLGDFSMSGIYEVEEGDYAFSFQDVITKDFELRSGSRVVFSGDPYDAQLNLNAVYGLRATEYDLIGDLLTEMSNAEIERARDPQNFEVWLDLTGSLSAPEIGFDIRPAAGITTTAPFERRLFEVRQDENELNKQVFGLLVMNRFIPDESGITPLLSGAGSSVSEFLSKQLSVYLTDWLSSFLLEDVSVDISYRNFQTTEDQLTQQELQVDLSTEIFNDRISVNLGGNFDLNQSATVTDAIDPSQGVAGDFEIAYDITPDGRIRLKAFQRSDYNLYLGRNIGETGVGIFYSTEFDKLYDLVEDRRRRKARRQAEKAAREAGKDGGDAQKGGAEALRDEEEELSGP